MLLGSHLSPGGVDPPPAVTPDLMTSRRQSEEGKIAQSRKSKEPGIKVLYDGQDTFPFPNKVDDLNFRACRYYTHYIRTSMKLLLVDGAVTEDGGTDGSCAAGNAGTARSMEGLSLPKSGEGSSQQRGFSPARASPASSTTNNRRVHKDIEQDVDQIDAVARIPLVLHFAGANHWARVGIF